MLPLGALKEDPGFWIKWVMYLASILRMKLQSHMR